MALGIGLWVKRYCILKQQVDTYLDYRQIHREPSPRGKVAEKILCRTHERSVSMPPQNEDVLHLNFYCPTDVLL